jgi:uncharacterized protein YjbJ (UPF0337 family)
MLNTDILKGKWKEIKGEIRTHWGKLTDDEIEQTTGNLTTISGIIEQRYGEKKEEIQKKLNSIYGKFTAETESIKEKLK